MKKLNTIEKSKYFELKNDGILYLKGKAFAYNIKYDIKKETTVGYDARIEIYSTGAKISSCFKGKKLINFYSNTGVHVATIAADENKEVDEINVVPYQKGVLVVRPKGQACSKYSFIDYTANKLFSVDKLSQVKQEMLKLEGKNEIVK